VAVGSLKKKGQKLKVLKKKISKAICGIRELCEGVLSISFMYLQRGCYVYWWSSN
jgi:hypothetical protein